MSTAVTETEPRAPESKPPNVSSDAPEKPTALFRIKDCYPELEGPVLDWTSEVLSRMANTFDDKGVDCMADTIEFLERWKPGNAVQQTKSGNIELMDSLDEEAGAEPINPEQPTAGTPVATTDTKPQHDVDDDADDDELPKHKGADIGTRMRINHFFTGWAENVENAQAMLKAITCFSSDEERFTAISDDDGLAIEQMVRFVDRELDALVKRLNMAGDYDNPRVVTDGGYVWGLNTTATLIETPDETEGGAS